MTLGSARRHSPIDGSMSTVTCVKAAGACRWCCYTVSRSSGTPVTSRRNPRVVLVVWQARRGWPLRGIGPHAQGLQLLVDRGLTTKLKLGRNLVRGAGFDVLV
jgi:hypothetical protein